jgi:hypothetical protein
MLFRIAREAGWLGYRWHDIYQVLRIGVQPTQ